MLFSTNIGYLNLPFPLAISFFTFQSIAFLVNVYDNEILDVKAKDFFLFILFFPQLIAGPIVKYNNMTATI
jgi:alginate O-acetyltransferase complex protein AlgI